MPQSAWSRLDLEGSEKRKNLDLFGNLLGFRGGVLELVDDPVQLVRLVLDRLHLLPGEENFMIGTRVICWNRICDNLPDCVHRAVVVLSKGRLNKGMVNGH